MATQMASSVAFPSTGDSPVNRSPQKPPLLPFRRISLPSPPVLINRKSVASLVSFDSLLEEGGGSPGAMKKMDRRRNGRPMSFENHRRTPKRKDSQRVDEAREAKRRKVMTEFYETEKAYVEGLDLIYTLFLTPLIESLDDPTPLLERAELTSVFSNFVDIWNLHHSFFTLLSTLLSTALQDPRSSLPPLSPILVSHFPYLSLYTPFITSFPSVMSSISLYSQSNPAFGAFIARQESDERCGRLKLRDWLLTVVQRCPRYLLLLKDLISCTDPEDAEYASLVAVYTLLSNITSSLNTSLHTHSQTLALLALQRATPNLPFQLISPGRTLLKRGVLLQVDHLSTPKPREFLLFSDCLIWLAAEIMSDVAWLGHSEMLHRGTKPDSPRRPDIKRSRSKSENELPKLRQDKDGKSASPKKVHFAKRSRSPMSAEEKWVFKGKAELVDLEVVVSPSRGDGDRRQLELLSPEMSFAVYAESEAETDEWASALRGAKASLLVSLNLMHPNSTLTSSSSTTHLRKTLQALPYLPEEDEHLPKRGKVDHFVPAIWIPDGKTDCCMRCGRAFGWRRRRHHCRLCGRCVCANCSNKTFFIHDPSIKAGSRSARACNACYEAVFPLLDTPGADNDVHNSSSGSTLSSFPSWKSTQALPNEATPEVLMTFRRRSGGASMFEDDGTESLDASPTKQRRRYSRPLSYPSIPTQFHDSKIDISCPEPTIPEHDHGRDPTENESEAGTELCIDSPPRTPIPRTPPSPTGDPNPSARNQKRFSMPALALQTTPVITRPNATGEGRSKRYSLVMGGRFKGVQHVKPRDDGGDGEIENSLRNGVAAAKLNELLYRTQIAD